MKLREWILLVLLCFGLLVGYKMWRDRVAHRVRCEELWTRTHVADFDQRMAAKEAYLASCQSK